MADGEHSGGSRSPNRAEVVREGEHRPTVGDGAELVVGSVRELAVVDELRADDGVLAGLPGSALGLLKNAVVREWGEASLHDVRSE